MIDNVISKILSSLFAFSSLGFSQPNIIVLYSDDAGYADFGFQPNCAADMKKLTPNIDRIAKEGARFSNAYMAGSVCSPSRAGLMTGRYQQRFGYDNNLPPGFQSGLELKEKFGVKYLKGLGYTTGLVGKWHLGYPGKYHPNKRGFDWFYGLLQGSRPYYEMPNPSAHRVIQENGKITKEDGYVTDRFGDAACRFIRGNKDAPFFLFVSFTSPHGPLQPKPGDAKRVAHIDQKRRAGYAGLIVSLDDNVGKVLDCLKAEDLEENTIILFTNDNGGQTSTGANNAPLQGKKGTLWEGGVRVPWAMKWKGKIPAGSVIDQPVIALDLLPTFVEAAGGKVPLDWSLDGRSFLALLDGKLKTTSVVDVPRPLFWRQGGSGGPRAMREGKWKIVHDRKAGDEPALFDLSQDIGEARDLAKENGEVLKAMLGKLNVWEKQLEAPRWGPGASGKNSKKK
ncbi:MAG: sulfatase-like hydrolase/transferase [Akkermansiaceae bacterium]|nr:sulfatase-like hydrolase/transferase [Akkermansiaceae bacterium]